MENDYYNSLFICSWLIGSTKRFIYELQKPILLLQFCTNFLRELENLEGRDP